MTADQTREAWLGKAAAALADELLGGYDVPALRISVGWPGGRSNRTRTIGQCWSTASAEDGVNQIFISPMRGMDRTVDILGTLLHEMIHAVDDCQHGHKKPFIDIARAVGFVPKWTSSDNRSEGLNEALFEIAGRIGLFPHAALAASARAADEPKKQSTRMLKLICPDDGYTLRTTQKWIDFGLPTCPCGTWMELA